MRIKKHAFSSEIIADINQLLKVIQNTDENIVEGHQEVIIDILRLIIMPEFRLFTEGLRNKYEVPPEFFSTKTPQTRNTFREWISPRKSSIEKDFLHLNKRPFNLNYSEHASFLFPYLLSGEINIPEPIFKATRSGEEYRHKARLIFNDHYLKESEFNPGRSLYIQIFSNTKISDLHAFIDANEPQITQNQHYLQPYRHGSRYQNFKRDIQIYIFHLLDTPNRYIETKVQSVGGGASEDTAKRVIQKIEHEITLRSN